MSKKLTYEELEQRVRELEASKTLREQSHIGELIETIQAGVVVYGKNGTEIINSNTTAQKMLGVTQGQLLGGDSFDPTWTFILEDGSPMPVEEYPVSRVIATKKIAPNIVMGIQRSDKFEPIWTVSTAIPEFDENGSITQIVVSFMDISSLKKSEKQYRSLFENTMNEVHLWKLVRDEQGAIKTWQLVEANPAALKAWGKNRPDIIGKTTDEVFLHNATEQFMPVVKKIFLEGTPYTWEAYFPPTGQFLYMTSVPFGEYFMSTGTDITERKRMEEALRESEWEFRTLAENSPDNIQRLDRDGKHLYVNAAYAAALALPVDQIIGKTDEELGMAPESITFFAEMRERVYTSRQPVEFDFSYPVDGKMSYFNTHMIPEFDTKGNVASLLSVSRDITARKQAQKRELELKLETERRRLLTAFFENAAHEFRTPLATINASAYLMSRSDDPERRAQKAEQVEIQIKRITRIVDSLLLMTRLESDEALTNAPVDLGEVLQSVCEKVVKNYPKNHVLGVDIAPNLPSIPGNLDYLSDAIEQIVDNACQFTPDGGKIDVKVMNADDHIWIEIRDSGPGIPQESLPHIFETFWRQDTAHRTPGLGLGLPIAQKIIEQHGGKITIAHTGDTGSIFQIILPIHNNQ